MRQTKKPIRRTSHVTFHCFQMPLQTLSWRSRRLCERVFENGDGIDDDNCVGMEGVATGSYSAKILWILAGFPIPDILETFVLNDGMEDPIFCDSMRNLSILLPFQPVAVLELALWKPA
jgi:hypothetical protein